MWHEKEKNCRLSDQRTSSNKSFGDYAYRKVLPPSGNHVDSFNGFSGKRKVAAIDLTHKSNIKEFWSPVGVNEQESKNGVHAKKSFGEQATSNRQFTNYDNDYGNDSLEVWSTSDADSQTNATDKSNDASSSVPDDSLCHEEGPSSTIMPVGESVMLLTQQARPCQNEVQVRRSMLGFLSGKTYESDEQNHVRSQQKAASPEMKISKNTSVDDMLSSNGSRRDKLVGDCQKIVQHEGLSIADENIKLSSGKPLITVNDKLWDGRVQLSSSVTVSAVAFFKRSST